MAGQVRRNLGRKGRPAERSAKERPRLRRVRGFQPAEAGPGRGRAGWMLEGRR